MTAASCRCAGLGLQPRTFTFWPGQLKASQKSVQGRLTFGGDSMFCLEIFQVFLVSFVLRRLFVLSQFRVISFFGSIGLSFAGFPLLPRQYLPSLPNDFGYLSE